MKNSPYSTPSGLFKDVNLLISVSFCFGRVYITKKESGFTATLFQLVLAFV